MSGEVWRSLFDDGAVDATLDLFLAEDPAQFIARADEIMGLLEQFVRDHDERRPDVPYVQFEEPKNLRRCLSTLKTIREYPELARFEARPVRAASFARLQKLLAADPIRQQGALLLIERFEAFQAEPGPCYVNPMQFPDKRRNRRHLNAISKNNRTGPLPDGAKLQEEYDLIAARSGKRGAAGILAKRYQVTPAAVRKALKKQQSET